MLVKTLCPYCGVGCSYYLKIENNKVTGVIPDKKDEVSEGRPCIKGLNSYQSIYVDRVKKPMIRVKGKLKEVSWGNAYNFIYKNMNKLKSNEVAFYGSSPSSNEDNYILQKFAREVFKTENIDSCARLCHAATCYAFFDSFGIGRMPAKINDFKKADCILIIGSNPKSNYPVAFNKILGAKEKGAKLICVNPWKEETADDADLFLEIEDGTDVALLNCLLNLLVKKKKVSVPENIKYIASKYNVKSAADICNVKESEINKIANLIAKSKRFCLGFGMGLTQHVYGINNVYAAINLVLAKKGKIISMRGKANIQGVGDMGCLPRNGGNTFITSIFFERVKAIYVMESSPAQSLPDLNKVHKYLREMFVVLHTSYPSKTMDFADVVLPCCTWAEKQGTFTNAESRVRFFNKAVEPVYGKPNWKIICELAKLFKRNYKYRDEIDILREITKNINGYNLSVRKIIKKGAFVNYKIKVRRFHEVEYEDVEDRRTKEFPFLLTTARLPYQFCTGEMSSRSNTLNKLAPEALCLVNEKDAKKLKLRNYDMIRLSSDVGNVNIKVRLSDRIPEKLVVVPFHYEKTLVNKLMPLEFSPLVEEPNLKKVAVNIKRLK